MTSRVRVLPLMIIVMFLMFSEKALNIWQGASEVDFGSGIEFKPALAQQSGSAEAPQSAPGPGDGPADSEGLPPGSRPLVLEIQIASANERFNYSKNWLSAATFWMRGNSNWKNGKLY